MIRRILPVFLLSLSLVAVVITDTAEARHRRRCCCCYCCPCYYPGPCEAEPAKDCPMYRMMQMGGLTYYYTLDYDVDCTNQVPISFGISTVVNSTPCMCSPDVCCIAKPIREAGGYRKPKKGDHVINYKDRNYHLKKKLNPDDTMEQNGNWDNKITTSNFQLTVAIDDGTNPLWWAKVGRFHSDDSPTIPIHPFDSFIGYEVTVKTGGVANVPSTATSVITDPVTPYIVTVHIGYPTGDPNEQYNGDYHVIRVH